MVTVKSNKSTIWEGYSVEQKTAQNLQKLKDDSIDFLTEQLTWKDNYSENDANEIVEEYRKWISLMILGRDKLFAQTYFQKDALLMGMPSKHIDNVWHRHILFTKEYNDFCLRVNGEMLHHNPCTKSTFTSMSSIYTKAVYEMLYGSFSPIWAEKEHFITDEVQNAAYCSTTCQSNCNSCVSSCSGVA